MTNDSSPLLIVEDDPNDIVLVQRALRRADIELATRTAGNVAQARAYLSGEAPFQDRLANPLPRLILLDLKMPGGSGIDLLTWMRTRPELRRIPVVMLTSSHEQGDVNRAYDAGCNSYLVKPVAFEDLQAMLTVFGQYWLKHNTHPEFQTVMQRSSTGL